MTEGALKVWRSLPDMIRVDPSLAIIRHEHEKLHGKYRVFQTINFAKFVSVTDSRFVDIIFHRRIL